ncbi:MAG: hypothetical protein ACI9W6_000632, partial [Motiliproteus sp.]
DSALNRLLDLFQAAVADVDALYQKDQVLAGP